MARSVEQVEKELAAIEQLSKALADEFYQVVLSYLKSLGNAVQKQLILASYHLCTQGYPEAFLALSLKEKQAVQSAIRQVANTAIQEFLIWLPLSLKVEESSQNQPEKSSGLSEDTDETEETEETKDTDQPEKSEEVNLGIERGDMTSHLASTVLTNPIEISKWYQRLEKGISEILQTVSRTTNSQLRKYKILPGNLPHILLEAATKSSSYAEPVGNMPNLLNLKIEVGNGLESKNSSDLKGREGREGREVKPKETINLLTVHLRLSDIEFADPVVMAGRNQLRQLSNRLSSLTRKYQKKEQELIIAEAEAAWRSSWVEE